MDTQIIYKNMEEILGNFSIQEILESSETIRTEKENYLFAKDQRMPESYVWQFYEAGHYGEWYGIALYDVTDPDGFEAEMTKGVERKEKPYKMLFSTGIDERGERFTWIGNDLKDFFSEKDVMAMTFLQTAQNVTNSILQHRFINLHDHALEEEKTPSFFHCELS